MPRNGRTQRSASGFAEAAPQRIDFGQGKARTIAGTISASASLVERPGFSIDGDVELALLRVLLDRRVLDAGEAGALQEALDRRLRRADARALCAPRARSAAPREGRRRAARAGAA